MWPRTAGPHAGLEVFPDVLIGNFVMEDNFAGLYESSEITRTSISRCQLTLYELLFRRLAQHLSYEVARLAEPNSIVDVPRQEASA